MAPAQACATAKAPITALLGSFNLTELHSLWRGTRAQLLGTDARRVR